MTPPEYVASLTGMRRVRFLLAAHAAGHTPEQHAAHELAEQERIRSVNALICDRDACHAAIRRHARRHGREFR